MKLLIATLLIIVSVLKISEGSLNFELRYQWQYINFTWKSDGEYRNAIRTKQYIPENTAILGSVKYYKGRMCFAIPRLRPGVPVCIGCITDESPNFNPLITPYPNWKMNTGKQCTSLQNVLSMEIDTSGIMWIIDGVRTFQPTDCPPKLVLLDLNQNGKVVLTYTFPKDAVNPKGAFLNDIVLDEVDGGYAYITDNSFIDPGIVVFSKKEKRSWKLRDASMFPDPAAAGFVVNGLTFNQLSPVNGIALSPPISENTHEKLIFYSALTNFNINSVSTIAARNYTAYENGDWRKYVKFVGRKQNTGDGMSMDSAGNLYYGILSEYAVAKWNMNSPFSTAEIVAQDRATMIWVDAFGYDNQGNLFMMADNGNRFMDTSLKLTVNQEVRFRIFRANTGTNSYLYYNN